VPLQHVRLTHAVGDQDDIASALTQFDCCRGVIDDPVADEVNAFIRTDDWRRGADLGVNTTYLFFDTDHDPNRIAGYVTLAVDVVKLSTGERERLGRTNFPAFGALRLVMLGVDSESQGRGHGDTLLKWMVGKGRSLAEEVAFRFVIADVNLRRKDWYDKRQFQVNRAEIYKPDEPNRSTISMRLDLREA
jgi:ribosomal protein S18 acetylase RimI-like enzyme